MEHLTGWDLRRLSVSSGAANGTSSPPADQNADLLMWQCRDIWDRQLENINVNLTIAYCLLLNIGQKPSVVKLNFTF